MGVMRPSIHPVSTNTMNRFTSPASLARYEGFITQVISPWRRRHCFPLVSAELSSSPLAQVSQPRTGFLRTTSRLPSPQSKPASRLASSPESSSIASSFAATRPSPARWRILPSKSPSVAPSPATNSTLQSQRPCSASTSIAITSIRSTSVLSAESSAITTSQS